MPEYTDTSSGITNYLSKIRSIIDKYYLWADDIDEEELEKSTVEGYVEGLGDKYTEYISKDDMKEFTEDILGDMLSECLLFLSKFCFYKRVKR